MPGAGRNILVTGGGGYIGSHCILQLLLEDFNVIVVDNFVNSIKGNWLIYMMNKLLTIYSFIENTDVNNPDSKCMYPIVRSNWKTDVKTCNLTPLC